MTIEFLRFRTSIKLSREVQKLVFPGLKLVNHQYWRYVVSSIPSSFLNLDLNLLEPEELGIALASVKNEIKENCVEFILSDLQKSPKSAFYCQLFDVSAKSFELKDYLKSTSGCSSKILSRLICSSHKLRIESGRWMKPKVERDEIFQELADFCLTNSVENEIHLLCECSFFGDLRNRVFGSGLKIDPNVLPSLFNDPKLIRKTCRFLQAANNISKMKKG